MIKGLMTFQSADLEQMKRVENEIALVLTKYRSNTEAAILVFALVRCARLLLARYSDSTRQTLRGLLMDFLNERETPREDPAARLLIQ